MPEMLIYDTCIMNINTGESNLNQQKSTLIHEILYVLNYRLELRLKHKTISQLEVELISIIEDNPKLLDYLSK